jgi:hypothetical protein
MMIGSVEHENSIIGWSGSWPGQKRSIALVWFGGWPDHPFGPALTWRSRTEWIVSKERRITMPKDIATAPVFCLNLERENYQLAIVDSDD